MRVSWQGRDARGDDALGGVAGEGRPPPGVPHRRQMLGLLGAGAAGWAVADAAARAQTPGQTLVLAARRRGLQYGAAIRETDDIWRPERARFLRDNVDLYVPGTAALPDHFQPEDGRFAPGPLSRFIARAASDGKAFRLHALLYPKRDRPSVIASINSRNWRGKMDAHFEALRATPGAERAANIDVVNELVSATYASAGGYRPCVWHTAAGGPGYIVYAFRKARELWPNTPLYFCQDQTEQLADGWRRRNAALVVSALRRALDEGAPIDGYNAQAHLTFRAGFDGEALEGFLTTITRSLGLKLILGEFDVRTGYSTEQRATLPPSAYGRTLYDQRAAQLARRYLDVALPFVSGGQIITWGLTDRDSSWRKPPIAPGERPLPWDGDYKPKLLHGAMVQALLNSK